MRKTIELKRVVITGLGMVTSLGLDVQSTWDAMIAGNAQSGQFFRLELSAREKLVEQFVANGVAIVVTNQRFAGVGTFSGGWKSLRRIAGEAFISAEVRDLSAMLVTSDRLLTYYGRSGAWAQTKR